MRNGIKMRKSFVAAVGLAALTAGAIPVAQAAAVVTRSVDGCGLLDGNGAGLPATDPKITYTQNSHGNATFQCKADVTPAASGGAVQFNYDSTGFYCGVPDPADPTKPPQMTQHWEETVSASGNATLTCHLP